MNAILTVPRSTFGKIAKRIATLIDTDKQRLSNKDLMGVCSEIGMIRSSQVDPHFYHELAEVALNLLVAEKYGPQLRQETDPAMACSEILRPLQVRLPTQTWRSRAQIAYQQYSTPTPIAYLMAYLVDPNPNDVILEPSAGTGCLAVWGKAAGANVVTNEIDPRRRELLRLLGFEPSGHNAEYIDDLLPYALIPDVVLVNPPFSANGGRTKSTSSSFGFRHVESALRRLRTGGRFGVILGEGGSPRTSTGTRFWGSLNLEFSISQVIEIDGREYYRNGTTTNVTLIIGRKCGITPMEGIASETSTTTISVRTVEEAFAASSPT